MPDQFGSGDADESRCQSALRRESSRCARGDAEHGRCGAHVFCQVKVVGADGSRRRGDPFVAVVRQARHDGIHALVAEGGLKFRELCGIEVDRLNSAAPSAVLMGGGNFGRGARPRISERQRVVAGLLKQSGNQRTNLAGTQNQYAVHRKAPMRSVTAEYGRLPEKWAQRRKNLVFDEST